MKQLNGNYTSLKDVILNFEEYLHRCRVLNCLYSIVVDVFVLISLVNYTSRMKIMHISANDHST